MSVGTVRDSHDVTASRKDWLGLVVLAFAVLLISVDATVLDLALPFISEDLEPSGTQLLWIIDVYSFVLAGLLVTMGTLGDRIGRRRLLLIGAAGFGLASLIAAWSSSPEMLIAARVLQGVSGATLMPATLGLIRTMFVDPRQRTTAIGVWGAMAGGGAAAGPLVGGWLLEHFWWGSVFLVNIPVMIGLIALGPLVIPESKDPAPGRFDLVSAGLSMLAMVPMVYAVKETAVHGPSWVLTAVGVVGLAAGWAFVRRQKTLADPMIDLTLFARPAFSTAVLTNLLSIFALAGVLFFGSQYLQLVLDYRPLEAGLLMLPGTLVSAFASLAAAWLVRRWAPNRVLSIGLVIAAIGAAVMIALQPDSGPQAFVIGFVLAGAGVGVALTLTSDLVVSSVEPERAGAASAVSETAYELGVALGVAILGSVVLAIFRRGMDVSALTPDQAHVAQGTLGGAVEVSKGMPAPQAEAFVDGAQAAFVDGMHIAAGATAIVLLITAILVARMLGRR
ncbi:MFS transporter [Prescottella equi]|uniref:MFS transporter n=1 Tax=Rhodococcus hoagii TaxID=43767 RepID=A0AAE5IT92_RHOHA|nr:MFS transporter [Prescottella equi]MBM4630254.1 MFS transporter [Prescottella equi]ORL29497.1 MFS transporter [Prescottella equi]ORM05985.1 MFS transporter [Prescottella equi]ORM29613.1 MFS transporter [Prescottella equi]QPQ76814.1 MFS transporter [Prescottella equi]